MWALSLQHDEVVLRDGDSAPRSSGCILPRRSSIARESSDWDDVVQVELGYGGHVGRGEAAPIERYEETPTSALAFIEEHGALVGDDPFALEEIGARLAEIPGEQAAKAALDGALHDLQGKLLGVPVWKLLGLPARRATDLVDDLAR